MKTSPTPPQDSRRGSSSQGFDRDRAQFATAVLLSKRDAFEVCEACAEAERALLRSGRPSEAARMAALFELIEGRLVLTGD